jgi:hypothetical protein
MAQTLYRIVVAIVPFVIFFSFSCKPVTNPEVGSSQDTPIPNAVVTIDTTYIEYTSLCAKGKVKNNGTSSIYPPWYVECQFYSDSTFSLKLGGANTVMQLNLDPGQAILWKINLYSSDFDVRTYPNFRVKDQRAIYKKQ